MIHVARLWHGFRLTFAGYSGTTIANYPRDHVQHANLTDLEAKATFTNVRRKNETSVNRQTVNLSAYPDLVVIYLGMQVRTLAGIKTLMGIGPQIPKAGSSRSEGLLHFETNIMFSLFPVHLMMRWYWRDFEAMERWARSEPHRRWWQDFLRNSRGTGFWHEMYSMRGGMEAIYDDVTKRIGFLAFAPSKVARGPMFSARRRLGVAGDVPQPDGTAERELY